MVGNEHRLSMAPQNAFKQRVAVMESPVVEAEGRLIYANDVPVVYAVRVKHRMGKGMKFRIEALPKIGFKLF
jgi:hypothetical protein